MMQENQHIELKTRWKDDWLKEICGFANSQGGSLYIGVDDSGSVIGVDDLPRLLDLIPSKIRDYLGIVCGVNRLEADGLPYIQVLILASNTPVSLRGKYYARTGTSTREPTGPSLNDFLQRKIGSYWDSSIEQRATLADIDLASLSRFRVATERKSRIEQIEQLTDEELLEKLALVVDGKITRAAIVLFGKTPNRFLPSARIKIGRFASDSDIKYDDLVEKNLIDSIGEVSEILDKKYLIRTLSYEGMLRQETPEYPVIALREMLLNAMVHRDYSQGAGIQLKIYDDKLVLWNIGSLLGGLTIARLKQSHSSIRRNPLIAQVCYLGSYIEQWGSGIQKIVDSCSTVGLPEPRFEEKQWGFEVTLFQDPYNEILLRQTTLSERQIKAILYTKKNGTIANKDYQDLNQVANKAAASDLGILVEEGYLQKVGQGRATHYVLV